MKYIKSISAVLVFLIIFVTLNAEAVSDLFLGQKTPISYRAFPLEISAEEASMVSAGSRVDILMTFQAMLKRSGQNISDNTETITITLLQNMLVLETAKIQNKHYIFINITPREAQYLALAQEKTLNISLRNPKDRKISPMPVSYTEN